MACVSRKGRLANSSLKRGSKNVTHVQRAVSDCGEPLRPKRDTQAEGGKGLRTLNKTAFV